ncbi:hypothetical protein FB551_0706 [Chryseobacterium aquifrigidense]|uniref:Uncharacterized protein n=1 Tax=Chryseobacterium aquifrigidense TaxID=558021 RepID=A0A543EHG9_9FLAO|nr:hypothetical protein FB551_0706 [Chryseobacterium aquifrigidense]
MEKFRKKIDSYVHRLENRWNALTRKRQRTFTKLLLAVYILITVFSLFYIWSGKNDSLSISHISGIPKNITVKNAVP